MWVSHCTRTQPKEGELELCLHLFEMMMLMRGWRSSSISSYSSAFHLLQHLELGKPKSPNFPPFLLFNYFFVLNKKRPLFYSQISYFSTTPCNKSKYVFDKIDDALNKFDQMVDMLPRPSVVEFNQLVASIVRMKYYPTAISLFRQIELLGIQLDNYAPTILINCFCQIGRAHV